MVFLCSSFSVHLPCSETLEGHVSDVPGDVPGDVYNSYTSAWNKVVETLEVHTSSVNSLRVSLGDGVSCIMFTVKVL